MLTTGGSPPRSSPDMPRRSTIQPNRVASRSQSGFRQRPAQRPSMVGCAAGLSARCGSDHRQGRKVCQVRSPESGKPIRREQRSCPQGKAKMEAKKDQKEFSRARRGSGMNSSPNLSAPAAASFPSTRGAGHPSESCNGMPKFLASVVYGTDLLKAISASRTPLGNFIQQSFVLHMMESSHCSSKDLWPCPVPERIASPEHSLSGRRRTRHKLRVIVREHLRVFVASANWLVLGRPKKATAETWTRQPLSTCQSCMLEHLEHSLRVWYRQSSGLCSDLQRSEQKFTSLHEALAELSSACRSLQTNFDPYSRPRKCTEPPHEGGQHAHGDLKVTCKPPSSFSAVELEPSRLKFSHSPSFKASKFISDPLLKAGFLNPKHLRLPKETWPSVKPARVMCSREKLLQLFKRWDDVHSLQLLDANASEFKYRCGLFAVYKNAEKDRQILNPIPENGRTFGIAESTHNLAHGTLLCNLVLDPAQDLVIAATDLEDYYHAFVVSKAHAARNHIHGVFPAETFKDWNCWDPTLAGKLVVGCFATLAMGTNYAVEIAQHTHSNLLKRAGCLLDSQQVKYRHPFPRGEVYQLLCIDDYAVLQQIPRGVPLNSHKIIRQDLKLLNSAQDAYLSAGLRSSKSKTVKNAKKAVVLGGEIDGVKGTISAPKLRIHVLCKLTLALVNLGWGTKHLIQSLLGCWIFVLLFRRPLLALLSEVFHAGDQKGPHEVFPLNTGTKHELLLLCIWAPHMYTNLRAQPAERLFCSDASLEGAGVCQAPISREATMDLARLAEQKGFYTRVDTSTLGQHLALQGEHIAAYCQCPNHFKKGSFGISLKFSGVPVTLVKPIKI